MIWVGSQISGCWPVWFVRDAIARFELTPIDVVVFVVICSHADGERLSRPSHLLIAEEGNVSRTSVKASVKRLIREGLLIVVTEARRGRAQEYEIPKRMPRPGQVRFLPTPTRSARYADGVGWVAAP